MVIAVFEDLSARITRSNPFGYDQLDAQVGIIQLSLCPTVAE